LARLEIKEFANVARKIPKDKKMSVISWFQGYLQVNADYMPHLDEVHVNARSLQELYEKYERFCVNWMIRCCSPQYFKKTVREEMGDYIKIRKNKAFTKCTKCVDWDIRIGTGSQAKRAYYKRKKRCHMERQENERRKYYKHRWKSRSRSHRYMSAIIDGMDQNKTDILRLKRETAGSSALTKLGVSVIGVICHGHEPRATAYLVPSEYPKDSSFTMQVVVQTILATLERNGFLPPIFYLQLDNTGRENKNKTMMALMSLLVEHGIFDKVIVLNYIQFVINILIT
jgi:hypothetical protein